MNKIITYEITESVLRQIERALEDFIFLKSFTESEDVVVGHLLGAIVTFAFVVKLLDSKTRRLHWNFVLGKIRNIPGKFGL